MILVTIILVKLVFLFEFEVDPLCLYCVLFGRLTPRDGSSRGDTEPFTRSVGGSLPGGGVTTHDSYYNMDDGRRRKTFEDGATCVREGSSYPSTDRGASSEA